MTHVRSDGQRRRVLSIDRYVSILDRYYAVVKVRTASGGVATGLARLSALLIEARPETATAAPIYTEIVRSHGIDPLPEKKPRRFHWRHKWEKVAEHRCSAPFTGVFDILACEKCPATTWKFHRA